MNFKLRPNVDADLVEIWRYERNSRAEQVRKYADEIKTDPIRSLEWGDAAFRNAAWVELLDEVLEAHSKKGCNVAKIVTQVNKDLVAKARLHVHGASACHALMDHMRQVVRAEFVQRVMDGYAIEDVATNESPSD